MDRTTELIRKAHEGDQEARTRLVEENVGLVWCIVRRYSGRGTEAEDLFQIGSIGLLKAIDKFDLAYDVRFSTYAVPMISGEIRRFLRDDGDAESQPFTQRNFLQSMSGKRGICQKVQPRTNHPGTLRAFRGGERRVGTGSGSLVGSGVFTPSGLQKGWK